MNNNTNLQQCERLVASLEALGAKAPKSILETLAVGRKIHELVRTQPDIDLARVVREGTSENIIDSIVDFAAARSVHDAAAERYNQILRELVKRFVADLESDAGDAMFAALRPAFNEAARAIEKSLEYFGPETGAEQVIEMKPDAVAAWQSLRKHRATLEAVFAIASDMDVYFDALGPVTHLRPDSPPLAFVIAEPTRSLNEIVAVFKAPPGRNPAGRWARLATAAKLELRTPSQAHATIQRLESEAAEALRENHDNTHRELKEVV